MSGVTTISGVGEGTGDSSSIPRVGEGTGDSSSISGVGEGEGTGDFSSIPGVGEGTGDFSGSELGLGCSGRARTLSLSPAGAATTPASTPRQ